MPIQLPQLSRREFLQRTALAGAALALAPSAHAGWFGKSRDKHTFALLSDTHVAADAAFVSRKHNMADNLAAVVREVAALKQKPAHVIVNGDLALKVGLPGDYATFARLVTPLRSLAPLHLNLGNHDQRDNFWQAFPTEAAAPRRVHDRQLAVVATPRANLFLLDSLDTTDSTPGELGVAQLAWLDRELAARREKPAVILGHHNLQRAGLVAGMKDSAALAETFSRHPNVKAFVFGHTHNWEITRHDSGVHLVNLPPVGYPFKEGQPTGWVRATLARDGMELELRSLDPAHPQHGKITLLAWRT